MNQEAYKRYSYHWTSNDDGEMVCRITDEAQANPDDYPFGKVIMEVICNDADCDPPAEIRAEYERLIEWRDGDCTGEPFNIVELLAEQEDATSGFNQPCMYGNLVDGHAVYCHNSNWLYSPRKCRRTWYTGGETKDEDCEGFKPNVQSATPVTKPETNNQ